MSRILAALPLFLATFAAYADVAPEPPAEASVVGTIVFAVLFFGACGAFAYMVWRNSKKKSQ